MKKFKLPEVNMVKVKAYLPMVVLGIILVLELAFTLYYFPRKIPEILEINRETMSLGSEVEELSLANRSISAVDEPELTRQFALAEKALPDEKRIAGLVFELATLASGSGVTVNSIGFSPGRVSTRSATVQTSGNVDQGGMEIGDRVRAVPVSISVSSHLRQLMDYLGQLQGAETLLGPTGFSYDEKGVAPGGEMGVLVYFMPSREGKPSRKYVPTILPEEVEVLNQLTRR